MEERFFSTIPGCIFCVADGEYWFCFFDVLAPLQSCSSPNIIEFRSSYALVGQNGVGKTTLMNAINNGKIEGWPKELVTAYVDSGSNVDPTYEALIVIEHLVESTGRSKEECIAKLEELEFTMPMMEGNIGSLSGGWQMKLRLARAVLIDPDIYLLDEPTNHLSASAVNWITNYLQSLDHQTILVVSHDTTFLENVCTYVDLKWPDGPRCCSSRTLTFCTFLYFSQ